MLQVVGDSFGAAETYALPAFVLPGESATWAIPARAPGGEPCTFLLDEVLELRTFESFPGLRHVLRDPLEKLTRRIPGA